MKKVWKWIRLVVTILLLLLLIINLYFIGASVLGGEKCPKLFGYFYSIVITGSMKPEFSEGDLLIYKQQNQYQVGDVVIFHHQDSLVTHRIIGEGESDTEFITKGDANNIEDTDRVKMEQIEGKMIAAIPKIGEFFLFLRTTLGNLFLILMGILFIEVPNIYNYVCSRRRRN